MEKISLFNYEAFYLDYLEGNLNEEDTALLMDFLEKHPECQVDDSILDSQLELETIAYTNKHLLKETDLNGPITLQNVEHFIVAQTEGILSEEKSQDLGVFVEENSLQDDLKLAEVVYFAPDLSVKYQHKSSLKQTRTIVLWPYVASAAAVGIIAFLMLWNSPIEKAGETPSGIVENDTPQEQTTFPAPVQKTTIPVADNGEVSNQSSGATPTKFNSGNPDPQDEVRDIVADISKNPVRPIVSGLDDRKLAAITKRTFTEEPASNEATGSEDYASLHFSDMNNPIKPITKFVAEKTNTDLDFRSRKTSNKKPGGFYIKIGKFEVSRKKH